MTYFEGKRNKKFIVMTLVTQDCLKALPNLSKHTQ